MTPDEEEELERLAMLRFRWQDRALKARAEVAELVERLGRIEGENQAAARMILERDERITELEHVVEVLDADHKRVYGELVELREHLATEHSSEDSYMALKAELARLREENERLKREKDDYRLKWDDAVERAAELQSLHQIQEQHAEAELAELRAHHHDPTTGMATHDHEEPKPIRPNRTEDSI